MMQEVLNAVTTAVDVEYFRAAALHGPAAASTHEGYALIKEEIEEAQTEMETLAQRMEHFWTAVKADETRFHEHYLKEIRKAATLAACELIQAAAMAEKTLTFVRRNQKQED